MSNYIDSITSRAEKKLQNLTPIPKADSDEKTIDSVIFLEKVFDLGSETELLFRENNEKDSILHSIKTNKSSYFWLDKKGGSVKLRATETIIDGELYWNILEAIPVEGIEPLAANHSSSDLRKINKFGGKLSPINRRNLYQSMSEYEKAGGRLTFEDHVTQDEKDVLGSLSARLDLLRSVFEPETLSELEHLISTHRIVSDSEKTNIIKIMQALCAWALNYLSVYSSPDVADVKCSLEDALVPPDTVEALLREFSCIDADATHRTEPLVLVGKNGESVAESFAKVLKRSYKILPGSTLDDNIMVSGSSRGYSNGEPSQLYTSISQIGKYGVLIFRHLEGIESKSSLAALENLICKKKISDSFLGVSLPVEHLLVLILSNDVDRLPEFCRDFKKIVISEFTGFEMTEIVNKHLLPRYLHNYGLPPFVLSKPSLKTLCAMALDQTVTSVEAKLRDVLGELIKQHLDPTMLTPKRILSMFYTKEKQNQMVSLYANDWMSLQEKFIFCRFKGWYHEPVKKRIEELFTVLSGGDKEEASYAKKVLQLLVNPLMNKKRSSLSVDEVKKKLDGTHFGLDQVKEAAVLSLIKAQIAPDGRLKPILLVGPPGTGKTSISKSIAEAFNMPFFKVPLNSVTDRGDLIGNNKTVKNAKEGMLLHAVNIAGTYRMVMLLDEVDKLSEHLQNVLLNILDDSGPAYEAYCECNIDLRQVFFIGTANSIHHISEPLRDRFKIVYLAPYTEKDKMTITRSYIIPKLKKELNQKKLQFTEDAIEELVKNHCSQDGVRDLSPAVEELILKNLNKQVLTKEDVVVALGSTNSKRKYGF